MAREPKCRRVWAMTRYQFFKPVGAARSKLHKTVVRVEEIEAVPLKDLLGLVGIYRLYPPFQI